MRGNDAKCLCAHSNRPAFFNAMLKTFARSFCCVPLALLLAVSFSALAQAESGSETAVKTAFLYHFFKFIDWPETTDKRNAYNLCTTSNDQLGDSLSVLKNKTIGSTPMLVRRNINGDALKNCQMVFISASENAADIIQELAGMPVVTVSDRADFIDQGGMIGLVRDGSRLSFEINLDAANSGGVHISARLLKLAKYVSAVK